MAWLIPIAVAAYQGISGSNQRRQQTNQQAAADKRSQSLQNVQNFETSRPMTSSYEGNTPLSDVLGKNTTLRTDTMSAPASSPITPFDKDQGLQGSSLTGAPRADEIVDTKTFGQGGQTYGNTMQQPQEQPNPYMRENWKTQGPANTGVNWGRVQQGANYGMAARDMLAQQQAARTNTNLAQSQMFKNQSMNNAMNYQPTATSRIPPGTTMQDMYNRRRYGYGY